MTEDKLPRDLQKIVERSEEKDFGRPTAKRKRLTPGALAVLIVAVGVLLFICALTVGQAVTNNASEKPSPSASASATAASATPSAVTTVDPVAPSTQTPVNPPRSSTSATFVMPDVSGKNVLDAAAAIRLVSPGSGIRFFDKYGSPVEARSDDVVSTTTPTDGATVPLGSTINLTVIR